MIAAADIDEDGKSDVVTTSLSGFGLGVLLGSGDGAFETAPDIEVAASDFVTTADLNGDGHLDLVGAGERLAVLLGHGDGTFESPVYYDIAPPQADAELNLFGVDAVDLNGDGVLDLVAAHFADSLLAVLVGNGDGTFGAPTLRPCDACLHVRAADLDGDGDRDVVATSFRIPGPGYIFVFSNDGSGVFGDPSPFGPTGNAIGLALADVDGDGASDAVTSNDRSYSVSVFLGRGDGTFADAPRYASGNTHSVAVADLDGDRILDLVSTSIDHTKVWFHRGVGDGTFAETAGIASDTAGGLALADMDGDGKLDLILGSAYGPPPPLLPRQWISVYLQQ